MKITETRKAIIELIEPYMDKTLSEGCLLITNQNKDYIKVGFIDKNVIIGDLIHYLDTHGVWCSYRLGGNYTILGHYDLTAVEKYIDNLSFYFYPGAGFLDNLYFSLGEKEIEHKWQMDGKFFIIPNKPLHLYIDEEDKQLLDLLLKLK